MYYKFIIFYSMLFLIIGIFLYFTLPFIKISNIHYSFKNYTAILIKNESNSDEAIMSLSEFFGDTITHLNQNVYISTLSNEKKLFKINPLNIYDKLLKDDIRIDKYIQNIENIFYSKDKKFKIAYVNRLKNIQEYKKLQSFFESKNIEYHILELFNTSHLIIIFSTYILGFLLFVLSKKGRFLNLSISFMLSYLIANSGIYIYLLCMSLYLILFVYIDKLVIYKKDDIKDFKKYFLSLNILFAVNIVLISIDLFFYNIKSLLIFFSIILIIILSITMYFKFILTKIISQKFEYGFREVDVSSKRIKKILGDKENKSSNIIFFLPIFLLFSFAPFILFFLSQDKIVLQEQIPIKTQKSYRQIDFDVIEEQFDSFNKSNIPNIGSYLVSMAYQEGLIYGKKFETIKKDESVQLPFYQTSGDSIFVKINNMIFFDNRWINDKLEMIDKSSFINLYKEDGLFSEIQYGLITNSNLENSNTVSMYINFLSIIIFIIVFYGLNIRVVKIISKETN